MAKFNPEGTVVLLCHYREILEDSNGWRSQYGKITLTTSRRQTDSNEQEYYTGLLYWNEPLKDVEITVQYDAESAPYAMTLTVGDVSSLERAQAAVNIYKAIDRGMARHRAKFGYMAGHAFTEWLAVVCDALDIETIVFPTPNGWTPYRTCGIGEAMGVISTHVSIDRGKAKQAQSA